MRPIRSGAVGRCLWSDAEAPSAPGRTAPPPDRVDVAIVGGGYTGLAAALALARRGVAVAVLERHRLGWGASGRNGGFVLPGFQHGLHALVTRWGESRARWLFHRSLEAVRSLESLVAAETIACDHTRCGSLLLAARPRHLAGLERERRCLERLVGHETVLLGAGELAREIGTRRYHGGLVDPSGAALHPAAYCAGLAAAAERAGARLHEGAGVTAVRRANGGITLVTAAGPVRAHQVLVATDGCTGPPFRRLRRRVVPVGSHIIATAPLEPGLAARLIPAGRVMSDTRHLLHYFRLSPGGHLLFGGRCSLAPIATARAARMLGAAMRTVFPELAGSPIDYAWSGQVGFTLDRLPHAGRLDGVHYAVGYGGHGVALATWLGTRMGEALAGAGEVPDLGPLRPVPLYDGWPWFLPLVDAYYRVRDRLG